MHYQPFLLLSALNLSLGMFNFSMSYTDEDQPIIGWQPGRDPETNLVIFTSSNFEDNDILNASISFPWEITSFWNARFNAMANWRRAETLIDSAPFINEGWAYFLNTTQSFQVGEDIGIELTGRYNSRVIFGLNVFLPRVSFDLAVQKTFANQAKLSLAWLDLFNNGSFFAIEQDIPAQNAFYDWRYELEGNIVRLTYSMPFGNKKLKTKAQRQAGSEDVQQRATN